MKITQYSATKDQACGIGIFSKNLHDALENYGCDIRTYSDIDKISDSDICIIHCLDTLKKQDVAKIQSKKKVLFLHFECASIQDFGDAYIIMNPSLKSRSNKCLYLQHPGYVGKFLDRFLLKKENNLEDKIVIGSNGFINKKRQFVEIAHHLLKTHDNVHVQLICTRHHAWEHQDIELKINDLQRSGRLTYDISCKSHAEINKQMQMCDLLWCWTTNTASDYASGVISDLYASGSRVVAPKIMPYQHLFGLENIVFTSHDYQSFVKQLDYEILSRNFDRHFCFPHTWESTAAKIVDFLQKQITSIKFL